jgi:2-keto-4-pentenoate hydratase/2-oxohepta-3-ene-1,7-dioic acid hydratase in catechol pathway
MRLASIRHPAGTALAGQADGGFADLSAALDVPLPDLDTLCAVLPDQPGWRARLGRASARPPRWATDEVRVLAPVRRPSKIICIGLNYLDHCRETGTAVPATPVVFAKFPSAIADPGGLIDLHPTVTKQVDWEVELAAVVAQRCGPGTPPTPDALLGYTIANDVSARDLQHSDGQWTRAKSLDTFCPLGPVLVTPDEIGDPQALSLGLTVNGEDQQRSTTSEMIFPVADLIRRLAAEMTLLPGDLVLTGTPHGTGGFQRPPRFLAPGDAIAAWIEGIGTLSNTARGPDQAADPAGIREPPSFAPHNHY